MLRGEVLIELLRDRPHATGAEIGVRSGETGEALLAALPELERLYCVDPWEAYPDYTASEFVTQGWLTGQYEQFHERLAAHWKRVWLFRTNSVDGSMLVEEESLDFVFIDACHAYEYVMCDLEMWAPKIKRGGLIAGHDWNLPGVYQAVSDTFLPQRWEIHTTLGDRQGADVDNCWWVWKRTEDRR